MLIKRFVDKSKTPFFFFLPRASPPSVGCPEENGPTPGRGLPRADGQASKGAPGPRGLVLRGGPSVSTYGPTWS